MICTFSLNHIDLVNIFQESKKLPCQHVLLIIREMGASAGYDHIPPMTLGHTGYIRSFSPKGHCEENRSSYLADQKQDARGYVRSSICSLDRDAIAPDEK